MPIDRYDQSFKYLVENELPFLLTILEKGVKDPYSMILFGTPRVGIAALARRLNITGDFPGCYVLIENGNPIYVGISRSVLQRLRQHVRGTTHFDASLAYKIAAAALPHRLTRAEAMKGGAFRREFDRAKTYLQRLNVAFVRIDNPLVRYIFEPYCAMHYDTDKWNTFETH
jgi:predicted GIY-YIG superfamily endonuclease